MLTILYVYLAVGVIAGLCAILHSLVIDIKTYFHNRKYPLATRSYQLVDYWWQYLIIVILVTIPIINICTLIFFFGAVWKPANTIKKYFKKTLDTE